MDGKPQTPQEERIRMLQSIMPEVFDEEIAQFENQCNPPKAKCLGGA